MRAYIIRRLLLVIPTIFLVTILVFFLIRLIPGDMIDMLLSTKEYVWEEEGRAFIEHELGLDVPVYVQYGRWVGVVSQADGSFSGLLQGDLGKSLWTRTPVIREIAERLPITVELGILAILITMIVSIPIGVYSAIRQDTWGDYMSRSLATSLIALPYFWIGLMIILLGSLWLGLSPPLRPISFIDDPMGNLRQFIVPALVLGMVSTGINMRMTRTMMLEVLRQDYIRTAWAKGLRERVVILRHALKNALIPVVTQLGFSLRLVIGGSIVIEVIFGLPGMGRLLVDAVSARDYTIVSAVVLIIAGSTVLVNLAVDLTYGYLDPRIHLK